MQQQLNAIHQTSMAILAKTGVMIHNPEALEIFRQHGAKVDGERVFLSEELIMRFVQTAPATFKLRALNPDLSIEIGGGRSHYSPGAGAPLLVDEAGDVRDITLEDYKTLIRLFHASPHMTLMSSGIATPVDVAPAAANVLALYHLALMSDKPMWVLNGKEETNRRVLDILEILFGENLSQDKSPVTMTVTNALSPLSFDYQALNSLIEFSRKGQPSIVAPCVMAGSTGPVTMAGTIAQTNAETLVGIVLSQMVAPGTPVVYGFQSTGADMRTGAISIGSPEQALCATYGANLARFYDLPSRGGGALTDASGPGMQSSFEAMMTLMATRQAGMNVIIHGAGIVGAFAAISVEQAVLGLEMIGAIEHFLAGVQFDEASLALSLIDNIGPGGQYLTTPHTVKNCRRALYSPGFARRGPLEGSDYIAAEKERLAKERIKLDEQYSPPDIGENIQKDLTAYIRKEGLI